MSEGLTPSQENRQKTELEKDSAISVHPKVVEYINRARAGEDVSSITEGLPDSIKSAILEGLKSKEVSKESSDNREQEEQKIETIPQQYRTSEGEPLHPEIMEDIWIVPIYADPEKTKSELERKQKGIEAARQYYLQKDQEEVRENNEEKNLEEVRAKLGIGEALDELSPESYSKFKLKHGETGDGEYWWYEYRNHAAKQLKQSGKFEWGKERIYFDAPTDSFEKMRDILMRVASEQKIAIAFKYRDIEKTQIIGKDIDTRLVANFATAEDAARFFKSLTTDLEYQKIIPDRQVDYKGIRLDEKSEYASSYREQREPLERVAAAVRVPDGRYLYRNVNGKDVHISEEDYLHMMKSHKSIQQKLEAAKKLFV